VTGKQVSETGQHQWYGATTGMRATPGALDSSPHNPVPHPCSSPPCGAAPTWATAGPLGTLELPKLCRPVRYSLLRLSRSREVSRPSFKRAGASQAQATLPLGRGHLLQDRTIAPSSIHDGKGFVQDVLARALDKVDLVLHSGTPAYKSTIQAVST
jgi:hypothetical protein